MNPDINLLGTEERVVRISNIVRRRQLDLTVVAENIHDPHNISAMLRSCDAVGIWKVYIINTKSARRPKLGEKSSSSARKWVETEIFTSVESCYEALRRDGFEIYTTHLATQSKSLYEMDLNRKVALVFGNEHDGCSIEATSLSDGNFIIPQVGMIQSLNISVACAVTLYEAYRQREIAGRYENSQFTNENEQIEIARWLLK